MSSRIVGTEDPIMHSLPRLEDLELLKRTVFFTEQDQVYLRRIGEIVADQMPDIIDTWFSAHPHLYYYFRGMDGRLVEKYVEAVRKRSADWILESCRRALDREWLEYVYEAGLRHHRTKKNLTDGVTTAPNVPLRYVITFIYYTVEMLKPFLAKKGGSGEEVRLMLEAWRKCVILQVAIWSHAYANDGDW